MREILFVAESASSDQSLIAIRQSPPFRSGLTPLLQTIRQSPFANRCRFGRSPVRGEILFVANATLQASLSRDTGHGTWGTKKRKWRNGETEKRRNYASRITHYASRITHHALRITLHASRRRCPHCFPFAIGLNP